MKNLRLGILLGMLFSALGLGALTTASHAGLLPMPEQPAPPGVPQAAVRAYLAEPEPEPIEEEEAPRSSCSLRGVGVPEELRPPEGWSREVVHDGVRGAGAMAFEPDGTLVVGSASDDDRRRVVSRLEADGTLTDSSIQSEPDAVAIDRRGRVWLGAYDHIRLLGSLDGGSDVEWHTLHQGGNIDQLQVPFRGDMVFAALRDGSVLAIRDGIERHMVPPGEPTRIALDAQDDLWFVREESTGWWLYQIDGLGPRAWGKLDSLVDGLVGVRDMDWGPEGTLTLLVEVRDRDPLVLVTWDPRQPKEVKVWARGLATSDGDVSGLAWDAASRCLYLSGPDAGRVYRSCPCTATAG